MWKRTLMHDKRGKLFPIWLYQKCMIIASLCYYWSYLSIYHDTLYLKFEYKLFNCILSICQIENFGNCKPVGILPICLSTSFFSYSIGSDWNNPTLNWIRLVRTCWIKLLEYIVYSCHKCVFSYMSNFLILITLFLSCT